MPNVHTCSHLSQDILEGGNVRNALQELQQIIITPIKVYTLPCTQREAGPVATPTKGAEDKDGPAEGFQSNSPSTCDGESSSAPIGDGDIAGQFTRVMGKGELQWCPLQLQTVYYTDLKTGKSGRYVHGTTHCAF